MSREDIAAYIIALYVRLSSEDSKVDSLSIVNQLKALHRYVDTTDELAGAEVLEFVDKAVFKIFCKVATVTDERFPEPEVGACRKRQTQPPRQRPGLGRLPGKC